MPEQPKLAITDCASRGLFRPLTFRAVRHCSLLLARANFGRIRRTTTSAQLSSGGRRASKGGKTTIRRLMTRGLGPKVARCDPGAPFDQPKFSITSPVGPASQL